MKRRPLIIAAVVTVAALACVVPVWWEIWLAVAYEKRIQKSSGSTAEGANVGIVFYVQRADFLPGRDWFVPLQACIPCQVGSHSPCSSGSWRVIQLPSEKKGGRTLLCLVSTHASRHSLLHRL